MVQGPKGIYMLLVHTRDPKASAVFYEGVLGFTRVREEEGLVWLKAGEGPRAVEVLLHPWSEPTPAPHGILLELEYEDVQAVVERARAGGYTVLQEPIDQAYGLREAGLQDPDGHPIWLAQPLGVR